jgi:hypothetical protein
MLSCRRSDKRAELQSQFVHSTFQSLSVTILILTAHVYPRGRHLWQLRLSCSQSDSNRIFLRLMGTGNPWVLLDVPVPTQQVQVFAGVHIDGPWVYPDPYL